jgi:hypothetical protein
MRGRHYSGEVSATQSDRIAYSDSARSGGHPVTQVADYAVWFWWPRAGAWAAAAVLVLAAAGAAWRMPAGRLRVFCLALLAVNAASTVAFLGYTATGIDEVNQYYIGYFYWSAPVRASSSAPVKRSQAASDLASGRRVPFRAVCRWCSGFGGA